MRRFVPHPSLVLPALVLCALLWSQIALAWDPFGDELDIDGPATPSDPAPLVIPDGLYLVTDIYTGDVVTSVGPTTTYTTETAHETPGTYARVVDVVRSGDDSAFDGASFNGRARLADGRLVAGTYYEDFVLTPGGFLSVNIVFFQDDSETHAAVVHTSEPTPGPSASSIPLVAPDPALPTARPSNAGGSPATPEPTDERRPVSGPTAAPRTMSAAVALAPTGPSLTAIEVLRGRPVHLWLRAFADGVPVAVRSWRLVSGAADVTSRREGTGADPCDAQWLTLPPLGTVAVLSFEVTTDAAPGRVLTTMLRVAVRSPALGE
jgi:hypothetical protein